MKKEKFHTLGSPFTGRDRGWWEGRFRAKEESAAIGVQRARQRDSCTEDRCQPMLTSLRGLSAHPPGRVELGAEARALEGRSQGQDWCWLCEHSLKGASASQLVGTESRRKLGTT